MIGKILNNTYKLERALSEGGMGQVFVASHLRIPQRVYAIKRLLPELAASPRFRERFQAEAQAMMELSHPSIVKIEDFLIEDDTYFLVMEFVESRSLEEKILEEKRIGLEEVHTYMIQLLDGLEFCHQKGFVHRDLKPSNLLLTKQGELKISDFGISRQEKRLDGKKLTATGTVLGTPEYMSPEQIMGGDLDGRSDLYSTGIILFEMLTGHLPFVRTADQQGTYSVMFAHINEEPPPITDVSIPAYLRSAVRYCLEKHPSDRFQSARELREHLEDGYAEFHEKGELPTSSSSGPDLALPTPAQKPGTVQFVRGEQAPVATPTPRKTVDTEQESQEVEVIEVVSSSPSVEEASPVVDGDGEEENTVPEREASRSFSGTFTSIALLLIVLVGGIGWMMRTRAPVSGDEQPQQAGQRDAGHSLLGERKQQPKMRPSRYPKLLPSQPEKTRRQPPPVRVRKTPGGPDLNKWPRPVSEECAVLLRSCMESCYKRQKSQDFAPAKACRRHCWKLRLRGPYRRFCKDS